MNNKNSSFSYGRRVARRANAKINLYLDVLSRRNDGFHNILTVMHSLSLHDDVLVEVQPASVPEISLRVYGAHLPLDEKNLAYRAADCFMQQTGLAGRVLLTIRKKLPVAAGLAGGSSDAAATLLCLNELAGAPLSSGELLSLGASLGSDVPFCLAGGTQICRGRGEVMEPLPCPAPLFVVIAIGREHVSTPRAFAAMDTYYHDFDGSVPHGKDAGALADAVRTGTLPQNAATLYNAFEEVILPGCPMAATLRSRLLEMGAYAAHMSGSGPSIFGLFEREEDARRAAAALGRCARIAVSAME